MAVLIPDEEAAYLWLICTSVSSSHATTQTLKYSRHNIGILLPVYSSPDCQEVVL
jgi:hypothetical protein